jgi:beta-lactam-binding protein with PASTA domain
MSDRTAFRRGSGLVLACALVFTFAAVPRAEAAAPASSEATAAATTGCVVPELRGYRLHRARSELSWSNCALGRIRYRDSAPRKRGRVLVQSIRAGTIISSDRKVNITVGM